MLNTDFSPWPAYSNEEVEAVKQVLLSGRVNAWTGKNCHLFEKEFASFVGCEFAVALSNGSLALEAALRAAGIDNGDEVITTPRTFIATASSIVLVGGKPVFADVDLNSQNITAESIEKVISRKTKAILVVHLAGMPADMDPIMELAERYGLIVIEDCAQAHGAKYNGRSVGTIGHIGAWSFCQDKIMSTGGEGGMVTTNDKRLWSFIWSYKDHGKSFDAVYNRDHPDGFRWLHENFGSNWRMTEMQAVIGRIQLKKLPVWSEKRHQYSLAIDEVFKRTPHIRTVNVSQSLVHAHYKHYLFLREDHKPLTLDRDKIITELNHRGVPCYQGICSEVYREKAFVRTSYCPKKRLPAAQELGRTSLMFLVHPTLKKSEIEKTCQVLQEVLSIAGS